MPDTPPNWKQTFDPYAFVAPQTKADYIALLDEAILMAHELGAMWDGLFAQVRRRRGGGMA